APIKGWEKGVGFPRRNTTRSSRGPLRHIVGASGVRSGGVARPSRGNTFQIKRMGMDGRLHDVEFPCSGDGLRPALYLELAVDGVDIPFHGTHRNHEPVRNFTIGVARDDQAQYLQL